ncbi:hypothetical protein QJS10_CPB22g01373 [Acorus calamus]|uniref:Uncharacterized protein n=1 Tax=Acorus calamus TaxID=4465 RepID=A0AAV9C014_ACOCL|nr:hypothetical protein QJS10_CPB22g01373 [Acorus calamus]
MASPNEPILSRLDRLDILMGYFEEFKVHSKSSRRSSGTTSPSSGTATSDGGRSSSVDDALPKSMEKLCHPMEKVVMEAQEKGSLVDRIDRLEHRVLRLGLQMEEELEEEKRRVHQEEEEHHHLSGKKKSPHGKKGLKSLVISCVKAAHLSKT